MLVTVTGRKMFLENSIWICSLKLCNFTKITLRHGCFSVNFPKIFKTTFLQNTFEGLLLKLTDCQLRKLFDDHSMWFMINSAIYIYALFFRSSRSQIFKISVLKYFTIFTGKHLCWGLFNKVTDLKTCNFIKKRLQHRCFLVNITKFLLTAFLIEHFWWLLLLFISNAFYNSVSTLRFFMGWASNVA